MGRQLPLLEAPAAHWTLLDERARGTRFYRIPARGVLNTPAATGMPFWAQRWFRAEKRAEDDSESADA